MLQGRIAAPAKVAVGLTWTVSSYSTSTSLLELITIFVLLHWTREGEIAWVQHLSQLLSHHLTLNYFLGPVTSNFSLDPV